MTHRPLAILLVFGLLAVYVGFANLAGSAGFELATIETEINQAKKERTELQIKVSAHDSLQRVENEASRLSMTPIGEVSYLGSESLVAVK